LYLKTGNTKKACELASTLPHMRESYEAIWPVIVEGLEDEEIQSHIHTIMVDESK
jgi:hypothetical protein